MNICVLLVTYNHEAFIREAVDSILMQRFEGDIEIIVADDHSTDATLTILQAYEQANPGYVFRYLAADRNLGITRNYERGFAACTTEYLAVLEGDDFWTDPYKLSKQIRFLDEHRECVACSANYIVYETVSKRYTPRIEDLQGWRYLSSRSLIADNVIGNFSTCIYRNAALQRLPPSLFSICAYDWAIHITLAQFGLIGFMNEPMSVYRVHSEATWNSLSQRQKMKQMVELIPEYNRLTAYTFQTEFDALSRRLITAGALSPRKRHALIRIRSMVRWSLRFANATCPPFVIMLVKGIVPTALTARINAILGR